MSSLNWNLVESPFSVTISIKKSFIKDRFGRPQTSRLSPQHADHKTDELNLLNCQNKSLQEALDKVRQNYHEVKMKLEVKEEKLEIEEKSKNAMNDKMEELKQEISIQHEEVITLNSANDMLKEKVLRLNSELIESRAKTKIEIDEVKTKSKKEIKAWRKDLGEESRTTIKL